MKKFIGIVIFSIMLLALSACGGGGGDKASSTTASGDTQEFTITATNWKLTSDKELVVHKGDKVKLNLKIKDGFHGLELDQFGVNLQGEGSKEFTADKVGEYKLNCSVVCGSQEQHSGMTIPFKVVE